MFGKKFDFSKKHVIITGGSAGIGFSLALAVVRLGADVTIIARTESRLQNARDLLQAEVLKLGTHSKVIYKAVDVTDAVKVQIVLEEVVRELGPVDVLICNAGTATLGYFHELDLDAFHKQMQINFFGVLNVVYALYSDMVRRNQGRICLVGSALSSFGIVGYSAYCPSKYAVKGLADCLRNELQGTKVKVSFAMPPDTDTPGFAEENKRKPPETKEISEAGSSVFSADKVAQVILEGIRRGQYLLPTPDLGLQVNAIATKGLTPRSFPGLLLDMLVGLVAPLAHWGFVGMLDRVARKHATRRFARLWATEAESGCKS